MSAQQSSHTRKGSPREALRTVFAATMAFAVAALAAGCSPYPPAEPGRTLYIHDMPGYGRPGEGPAAARPFSAAQDFYWHGDGVSGSPRITIDLSEQRAYFHKGAALVGEAPVSTGDANHGTPTGSFSVSQKNIDHVSSAYGDFVDEYGNVVVSNVDSRTDRRPPGCRFRGASMPYFLRFNQGIGMHAGFLPGYPASHGCVRLPEPMARHFYFNSQVGTPVIVRH